jgi:hypothetical protein
VQAGYTQRGNLRRYLTPPSLPNLRGVCNAISGSCSDAAKISACNLPTTLVLDVQAVDFSTGGGNSALIVNNLGNASPAVKK